MTSNVSEETKKRMTKSAKSGLKVPVQKINHEIRKKSHTKRVSTQTAIHLAGVVEYALREIISLANDNVVSAGKHKRIKPRDIVESIRSDPDLARLFADHRVVTGDKIKTYVDEMTTDIDKKYDVFKKKKDEEASAANAANAANAPAISVA